MSMRTTVTIKDDLLAKAREYTGIEETPTLVRMGLELLVQREAGRRLARLGGTQPDLQYVPRRRPPNFINDESGYPELDEPAAPEPKGRRAGK
jgi:Arc/MetJ family transcription regulator